MQLSFGAFFPRRLDLENEHRPPFGCAGTTALCSRGTFARDLAGELPGRWQPSTPVRGTDVAGVVEAVGRNVTDHQPGDEVFGSSWADTLANRAGAFAEFTVVPASKLIKKPVRLSFEEAAASVMSGLTALIAIRDVGRVGHGTRVLINGASGGAARPRRRLGC